MAVTNKLNARVILSMLAADSKIDEIGTTTRRMQLMEKHEFADGSTFPASKVYSNRLVMTPLQVAAIDITNGTIRIDGGALNDIKDDFGTKLTMTKIVTVFIHNISTTGNGEVTIAFPSSLSAGGLGFRLKHGATLMYSINLSGSTGVDSGVFTITNNSTDATLDIGFLGS